MNPARTTRATYVAAFLLGVLVALLLLAPAHAVPSAFSTVYTASAH